MSYRNPEIITDKSGEITARGFASFGQSIAGGLQQWSANIEQKRKEQKAKDERQLQIKTTGQLNALKRSTDFNSKLPATTLTEEIKPIVRERLIYAADLSSELYSETDPQRRQELMKEISSVENFLSTTAAGLGKLNEDVSAYAELSPTELNAQYGIAGDKDAQINNQGFLTGLAGQADKANFKPYYDEKTNSIVVRAGGTVGGNDFYMEDFNFNSYVSGSDLIFPISQLRKEAADSASKLILDEKGNMKPGLVNEKQLQVITQDVVQNGKVTGKRKVQGQIETVNIGAIKQTINPLVDAEVDSLLDSSDQQKEAILNNQYGGLSWEQFASIKDPVKQIEALKSVIEPVIVTDVLGNDFKQGKIGGELMYYRETEKMQEVKPTDSKTTKEDAATNNRLKNIDTAVLFEDQPDFGPSRPGSEIPVDLSDANFTNKLAELNFKVGDPFERDGVIFVDISDQITNNSVRVAQDKLNQGSFKEILFNLASKGADVKKEEKASALDLIKKYSN